MKTASHVIAAALWLGSAAIAAASGRTCAVSEIDGARAAFWRFGEEAPLSAGALPDGEGTIETGPATRVEIRCDDGVVVTIGAETRVALESLTGAGPADNVVIQIFRGIVGAVAPTRAWSGFELRSPLAIAAIRSTEWFMQHDGVESSAVFVREGRVAVTALRRPGGVVLGPGEGVDVTSAGAGPAKTWGAPRVEAAGERLGFGWR